MCGGCGEKRREEGRRRDGVGIGDGVAEVWYGEVVCPFDIFRLSVEGGSRLGTAPSLVDGPFYIPKTLISRSSADCAPARLAMEARRLLARGIHGAG